MSCATPPQVVLGAVNLRIALAFQERNSMGKLVPVDLGPATIPPGTVQATFRKPSRALVTRPLSIDSPSSAGVASYVTAEGFLDEAGLWEVEGFAFLPGAPTAGRGYFPSRIVSFEVLPQIAPPVPTLVPARASLVLLVPVVSVS